MADYNKTRGGERDGSRFRARTVHPKRLRNRVGARPCQPWLTASTVRLIQIGEGYRIVVGDGPFIVAGEHLPTPIHRCRGGVAAILRRARSVQSTRATPALRTEPGVSQLAPNRARSCSARATDEARRYGARFVPCRG